MEEQLNKEFDAIHEEIYKKTELIENVLDIHSEKPLLELSLPELINDLKEIETKSCKSKDIEEQEALLQRAKEYKTAIEIGLSFGLIMMINHMHYCIVTKSE